MDTNQHELIAKEEVFQIVGCAIEVLNTLGHGLLEKPYTWCVVPGLPGCSPTSSPDVMIESVMHIVHRIREISDQRIMICSGGRGSSYMVTLALILLFGTLTLVLQDDRFIKWKPTVLYGAMSVALAVALWALKKNFLKMLLGIQLELPDAVWHRLNVAWILYCAFMSVVNAYVVLHFSTEAWVDFKLWGYAFPLVFLVAQGFYIAPYLKGDEPAAGK